MNLTTVFIVLLFIIVKHSSQQDIRSFRMSVMSGWQFQCPTATCSPFMTVTVSSVRKCQMICIAEAQCRTANFYQSSALCELFSQTPDQTGSLASNVETVLMTVIPETRIPPAPETSTSTTSTSTSTITTSASTSTTSTTTSITSTSATTTTSCLNILITPSGRSPTIAWDFQNNLNDRSGTYIGTGQNNPTYMLGRNNCGTCLNLTRALSQSVIVNSSPYLDLRSISFSVEAWVKPMIVTDGLEHVILAQCGTLATQQCMRTSIGSPGKMSFLFRSDTQLGVRIIPLNVWSHFAYIYNSSANTMSLYFNGTLEISAGSHGPYQGAPTFFQIGNVDAITNIYFDGCIDEIFFYSFARTASEISATFALG